ncbi:MAG: PD-(D/E)XK nuclease family protein [Pseudomonadales bacterium]|nr:PD-(D/E)XK nuclease family protein [Pseudomonadales bacterium]
MSRGIDFDLSLIEKALQRQDVILVPNARIRDAIFRELARRQGDGTMPSPAIYAIDIWIQRSWQSLAQSGQAPCCDLTLLDAREEQLLWTALVEDSLDQFPLLNPAETARSLSHAYQLLKQWQLQGEDGEQLQQFSGIADVAAFLYWQEAFQQSCQDRHCLNLVDAVERLIPILQKQDHPQQYCLVNFDQPPPLYQALLASLPVSENLFSTSSEAIDPQSRDCRRFEFADRQTEIQACAHWAAEELQQDSQQRLAVICQDRENYQGEFERCFRHLQDDTNLLKLGDNPQASNSAWGPRLTEFAIIHDALLILGLHSEQQQADDLCRLLRSSYIADYQQELDARQQMELHMRRRFSQLCSTARFSSSLQQQDQPWHCPSLAERLLAYRSRLRRAGTRATALEWQTVFRDLLECLGWPGQEISAREQNALKKWRQCLDNFAGSGQLLGKMSIAEALRRLQMICQQSRVDLGYRPQFNLSFYTPAEAAGLLFDKIWLLGFTDRAWPPTLSPSPFLPYELQKQHQLPGSHSEVQFALAEAQFNQLCQASAETIIASHPLMQGDEELRASSFILRFPLHAGDTDPGPAAVSLVNQYSTRLQGQMTLQQVTEQAVPLASDEALHSGQQIISDQSACPFRAFASHRLKAQEMESFSNGLDARSRGTAIHKALEFLFDRIRSNQDLEQLTASERQALCQQSAQVAVDYLQWVQAELMTPALRKLEAQRITALLDGFLDSEAKRGPYTIVDQERQLQWRFDSLELTLRIDRIDRLDDGSLAIIDYKSGKSTPSRQSWLQERPEDMQLPFYAVAGADELDAAVSAISLAHVHAEKLDYSGLAQHSNFHASIKPVAEDSRLEIDDWEQMNQVFRSKVEHLARDFIAGENRVDPANGLVTCNYCGLQPLCRIHQELESHGDEAEDSLTGIGGEWDDD